SHRLCDPDPWANGVKFDGPALALWGADLPVGMASFHPNAEGQAALYRAFMAQVGHSAPTGANPIPRAANYRTPNEVLDSTNLQLAQLLITPQGAPGFSTGGTTRTRTVTLNSSGYQPGSAVQAVANSTPVTLGTGVADANGNVELSNVVIP